MPVLERSVGAQCPDSRQKRMSLRRRSEYGLGRRFYKHSAPNGAIAHHSSFVGTRSLLLPILTSLSLSDLQTKMPASFINSPASVLALITVLILYRRLYRRSLPPPGRRRVLHRRHSRSP